MLYSNTVNFQKTRNSSYQDKSKIIPVFIDFSWKQSQDGASGSRNFFRYLIADANVIS